ncbi:MAG: putative DNA binding domain-containing protein [bacterium]|nr:putative DNA binding domain-containing protein [Acidimicrobiia bacterium]MCY4650060.1 putative DNA binding domain-containing protein [bacterium]
MSYTFSFLPPPRRRERIEHVLGAISRGDSPVEDLESEAVDIKEEAGRRTKGGAIQPGRKRNEKAAEQLAEAAACMANSPGGGTLIVGVENKTGQIIGADTDPQWLRSRIYDLTARKLTVDIQTVEIHGKSLLVIDAPQAVEPVPFRGKYQHRVDASCVPATSTQLLGGLFADLAADPSHQPSDTPISAVTPAAEFTLRNQLAKHDPDKAWLSLGDLLGRLGLLSGSGEHLNMAGEMLLSTQDQPAIDYSHRHVPGGPSTVRVVEGGRSLLEEVLHVEAAANNQNPLTEITTGLQVHKVRAVPERSLRESILNAVCHRDWSINRPTVVEHIGNQLRVTSPGGLIGGVTKDNIITHPSAPRYRTLVTAMRKIGLVEQEGVGVDLMFADMIRIGSRPPLIETLPDPAVRIVLFGRRVDEPWYRLFLDLVPSSGLDDVDTALLVWWASRESLYLTVRSCADLLQRSYADADESLHRAAIYEFLFQTPTVSGRQGPAFTSPAMAPLLTPIEVPADTPPAWKLSWQAKSALGLGGIRESTEAALAWTRERGRISSSEYREMTGVSQATATKRLKELADQGRIAPSSESGRGRGFHYLPV